MTTITIDRAVIEQALEALEAGLDVNPILAGEAEEALRAALAQQDAPAEESVEPVAWMFELARNFNLVGYGGWEKRITEYRPNTPEGSVRNVTPLYTAPPQRKPLTEKEIDACFHAARNAKLGASQDNSRHRLSVVEIARAVERAHGIKE